MLSSNLHKMDKLDLILPIQINFLEIVLTLC